MNKSEIIAILKDAKDGDVVLINGHDSALRNAMLAAAEHYGLRGIYCEDMNPIPALPTQSQDWRGSGKRKMSRIK